MNILITLLLFSDWLSAVAVVHSTFLIMIITSSVKINQIICHHFSVFSFRCRFLTRWQALG